MQAKSLAYRLFHPLLKQVRGNPVLIRGLFGVRVPRGAPVDFDPTTILLARAAADLVRDEDRASLEVGVGAGALVSLALALDRRGKGRELAIVGCDCVARRVESAKKVAGHNGVEVEIVESDLFNSLDEARRFDLILFNPPYVPTAVGEELQMGERLTDERTMWDGGADGLEVLRKFLAEAPARLAPGGRVLFGVQHVFVPDEAVCQAIDESPLALQQRYTRRGIPAEVYVLSLGDQSA